MVSEENNMTGKGLVNAVRVLAWKEGNARFKTLIGARLGPNEPHGLFTVKWPGMTNLNGCIIGRASQTFYAPDYRDGPFPEMEITEGQFNWLIQVQVHQAQGYTWDECVKRADELVPGV